MTARLLTLLPGLIACAVLMLMALWLGERLLIGSVMLAMLLGLVISTISAPSPRLDPGLRLAEQSLLALAIVLLGFGLDLEVLLRLGADGLWLLAISTLAICGVTIALIAARPEHRVLSLLLAMGTLVCGSAAIAAAARPLAARRETVCLAIAVINLLGVAAMLLLPVLTSTLMTATDLQAGVMIGNSLPAVGQVAAAGFTLGESAAESALLMKMARILMLVPLLLLLSLVAGRAAAADHDSQARWYRHVPLFLPGFMLAALLANLLPIPATVLSVLVRAGDGLLIMAMAAIGLRLSIPQLMREGRPALLAASALLITLIVISLTCVPLLI